MDLGRRRIVACDVTSNPTAGWAAGVVQRAFLAAGRRSHYLLRDRDAIYGVEFSQAMGGLGLRQLVTAYKTPLQNAHTERVIGTIRCECLDLPHPPQLVRLHRLSRRSRVIAHADGAFLGRIQAGEQVRAGPARLRAGQCDLARDRGRYAARSAEIAGRDSGRTAEPLTIWMGTSTAWLGPEPIDGAWCGSRNTTIRRTV